MKYLKGFKQACEWEFTWSILITVLVLWAMTGKAGISIITTLILASVKAIGLTIFLRK